MDTETLFRSLNEHDVRYVVIGATAKAAGRPQDIEGCRG